MAVPRPSELGMTVPEFETLVKTIQDCESYGDAFKASGGQFIPKVGMVNSGRGQTLELLAKSGLTPDKLAAVEADLKKEWELGSPVAQTPVQYTGYTPYNVEPAVLMIVPKELKIRNSTARTKGVGQGIEYRRVTGVSNSGSGGIANLSPFFTSVTNTVTINGTTLNRPPLISYAGDTTFKPYVEMGFTDAVSLQQQFAGQGFTDVRALSHLALIWSHVLGEERALLNARSTALNISSLAFTAEQSTVVTSGSGLPAITASTPVGDVYVSFNSSLGESEAVKVAGAVSIAAGYGIDLDVSAGVPAGAISTNVYVTTTGPVYWKGTTVNVGAGPLSTLTGAQEITSPTTFATVGAAPSTSADQGSGNALGYDGMISEFTNTSVTGYYQALNGALGLDTFTTALQTMYIQNGADPDWILTTGSITQAAFDLIQSQSSATSYRANFVTGDNGITVGGAVTGFVNPATGKVVEFSAHRYMPAGVAVLHSTSVPWPDSNVSATMKVSNVVDTMVIDWPQIGMSYDQSTYTYGTVVFEAPILSGCITSIDN